MAVEFIGKPGIDQPAKNRPIYDKKNGYNDYRDDNYSRSRYFYLFSINRRYLPYFCVEYNPYGYNAHENDDKITE